MSLILILKKISLLFLLISASLLSTSLAGRPSKFLANEVLMDATTYKETSSKEALLQEEEDEMMSVVHERLLKANTKDYGRYDPAPGLVRPPFKLIPN
ncbi:hypothetical protein EZV62_011593 [Acer yangbiense]|uniref:Protein CASPARIAN STRIP INTEGRITY FACTOR 1 n=1 Tax=Acer yangbiense TaxID=1000413 RepID=A0A5C7I752_9ROSI|nr:hypothetical protein EZV62_011593 [Acer yangbiense]